MYDSFNYNGIESSDFNIFMSSKPSRPIAAKRVQYYDIPGRNGHLTVDQGLLPATITVPCTNMDVSQEDLRQIKAWLSGSGKLIFSDEPDVYWKVRLDLQVDFTVAIKQVHQFILVFDSYPLAYSIDNNLITLTSAGKIYNPGTAESDPIIKIYGSGIIVLNVNDNIINLSNIDGFVVINAEMINAYKDTILMNQYMRGEFPFFIAGSNTISWTGTVSKIEIIPNWRWS
ncbi:MAG TPA: distal tail protein Dit [Clostridium sp.]